MSKVLLAPPPRTACYPFESQSFLDCWWEHQAENFNVRPVQEQFVLYPKPLFKGLVKLNELRLAGWNTAWAQDLTAEKVETFRGFKDHVAWDYFRMTWNEERESYQAFDQLRDMGFTPVQVPDSPEYLMRIDQGWEGYLKSRSKKTRHNIREKLDRVAAFNPRFVAVETDAEIDAFFEIFFKRHIEHWREKTGHSYFENPVEQRFLIAWAKRLRQSGELWLQKLYFEETVVNLNVCIHTGDMFYCLFFINTGAYMEYYPGLVNLYLLTQKLVTLGVTQLNLASGTSFYKIQASNQQAKRYSLIVANPHSHRGKLYTTWLQGRLQKLYDHQYGQG